MYACAFEIDQLPDEDEYDHRLLYDRPQATLDSLKGYHKLQNTADKLKKKLKKVTVQAVDTLANQPVWLRQLVHGIVKAASEGRPIYPCRSMESILLQSSHFQPHLHQVRSPSCRLRGTVMSERKSFLSAIKQILFGAIRTASQTHTAFC